MRAFFAIAVVVAAAAWSKFAPEPDYDGAEKSVNGFVEVAMPEGAKPGTVIVFAPPDCPSKLERRTRAVHDGLIAMGIPVVRSSHYSARSGEASAESQARLRTTQAVFSQGKLPIVFVNGMARGNPTAAQVAAEYERTTRGS